MPGGPALPRCHSHLGNFVFDRHPQDAIRQYDIGLRICELSQGDGFAGLLPWALIDNRPFLPGPAALRLLFGPRRNHCSE
ncbi:MAG: hypothetical protein PHR86_04355 [Desulfobacterales bacterium]|nr:hypothetical protein [Desulfobacterales bacterium]